LLLLPGVGREGSSTPPFALLVWFLDPHLAGCCSPVALPLGFSAGLKDLEHLVCFKVTTWACLEAGAAALERWAALTLPAGDDCWCWSCSLWLLGWRGGRRRWLWRLVSPCPLVAIATHLLRLLSQESSLAAGFKSRGKPLVVFQPWRRRSLAIPFMKAPLRSLVFPAPPFSSILG
jgi:hypothetical protein